jgi:hypothetical protein
MAKRSKLPSWQETWEEPFEWFELWYPQRQRDREKISEILLGKGPLNPVPYAILNYILSPQIGKSAPICRTVIVENRYYDKDHARGLSAFYSKSFREIKKECVRLHFFSSRLSPTNLGNLEDQQSFYLGFCVVRPFAYRKIGRTVLVPIRSSPSSEFYTCQGDFEVNIGGSRLKVQGAAFMEQDTMVAACATAALWMSTTTLAYRFDLQECPTSEITERAAQYLIQDRPMPSEGLLCEQMIHALRTLGYDPLLLGVQSQEQANHLIYSYIESEIPAVLLCNLATGGDHTLVAVGHGYQLPVENPPKTEVAWPNEPPLSFARSSQWVPYFLINDDQRGLYRKLILLKPNTSLIEEQIRESHPEVDVSKLHLEEWHCPIAIDMDMPIAKYHGGKEIANIWGIIIPLPMGVRLTSEQAERKAARLIRLWHEHSKVPLPQDLVLRTYVVLSNEHKRRIEETTADIFVKRLLRGKPMPRWIWVTEISSMDSYNSSDPSQWLLRGQVIIDATSSAWTPDFIAFHYIQDHKGILATMKPGHQDTEEALQWAWANDRDTKYLGWVRHAKYLLTLAFHAHSSHRASLFL